MLSLHFVNRSILSSCRCASIATKSLNFNIRNKSKYLVDTGVGKKLEDLKSKKAASMKDLEENFDPIYRFPKIRFAAAVNNMKPYQAILTVLSLPLTYFTFPELLQPVFYTSLSFLVALTVASLVTRNTIGAVYVHKKESDKIRIAFIDFWGRRQDSEFKVEDIVPIYETKKSISTFTTLKFKNNHTSLKFISTTAVILNSEEFSRVFGDD